MKFFSYIKLLIGTDTGNSSKSFALVMSSIISFLMCGVIGFSIAYDVITNGYIKTNLESTGIFLLCVGSMTAASGIPKIFGDRAEEKTKRFNDINAFREKHDSCE